MPQNRIFFIIFALFFSLSAEQVLAQVSSSSFKNQKEEYHEERDDLIEKFVQRMENDHTAMANGLKQCDIIRGSVDTKAEYFILYWTKQDKKADRITKELNKKYTALKKNHIQCVLFSVFNASEKSIKSYLNKNKIRVPMINATTVFENTRKYSDGNYLCVYPLYHLFHFVNFQDSYGETLRVHWKNGETLTVDANNLTEALEEIAKHKKKGTQ